jgi:hypothetical protein
MINRANPEFENLSRAAESIKEEFNQDRSIWLGSPFEWVLTLPSGAKGKLGKRLVYQWCALQGLAVDRSPDSEADMLVNGHRAEIKFSTLWTAGFYKFQQIRDQNYEFMICLGISPNEAHCWVLSKNILMDNVIGHLGQHTGAAGQETAWFEVRLNAIQPWLSDTGGNLATALTKLRQLAPRR